jgi:hypothetical protein
VKPADRLTRRIARCSATSPDYLPLLLDLESHNGYRAIFRRYPPARGVLLPETP